MPTSLHPNRKDCGCNVCWEAHLQDERDRHREELIELRRIGDRLQSEASRLNAWVGYNVENLIGLDYEAFLASLEIESAVDEWTTARAASSRNEVS